MTASTERVLAFFESGEGSELPDRPAPWYIDFGGAGYAGSFDPSTGTFHGTITAPGTPGLSTGFHFGWADTEDAVRRFGVEAHDDALRAFAVRHHGEIRTKVLETLSKPKGLWRALGEVGVRDVEEWEAHDARIGVRIGDTVGVTRLERWLPVVITVDATLRRKEPVTTAPLSGLTDRELDEVIEEYVGPEGVYMDGEIPRSQVPARKRQLRAQYRGMTPRQQTEVWSAVGGLSGHRSA